MLRMGGWYWYLSGEEAKLEKHKCGKWMYFFEDQSDEFIDLKTGSWIREEA